MNSETLSLRTIINELDLLKKEVIIQWNAWKGKERSIAACKQINRKKYLILVILKNTINHL